MERNEQDQAEGDGNRGSKSR